MLRKQKCSKGQESCAESSLNMSKKSKRVKSNIEKEKGNSREKDVKDKGAITCSTSGKGVITCFEKNKGNVPTTCTEKDKENVLTTYEEKDGAVEDRKRKTIEKTDTENSAMDKEEEEQKNPGKKSRQEEEVREVEMTSDEEPGVTGTKSLCDLSVGEDARMQIRERNLRRYKMLRTQI